MSNIVESPEAIRSAERTPVRDFFGDMAEILCEGGAFLIFMLGLSALIFGITGAILLPFATGNWWLALGALGVAFVGACIVTAAQR